VYNVQRFFRSIRRISQFDPFKEEECFNSRLIKVNVEIIAKSSDKLFHSLRPLRSKNLNAARKNEDSMNNVIM